MTVRKWFDFYAILGRFWGGVFWLFRGLTESGESTHDETRRARARWCEDVVFRLGAVWCRDGARATVRR